MSTHSPATVPVPIKGSRVQEGNERPCMHFGTSAGDVHLIKTGAARDSGRGFLLLACSGTGPSAIGSSEDEFSSSDLKLDGGNGRSRTGGGACAITQASGSRKKDLCWRKGNRSVCLFQDCENSERARGAVFRGESSRTDCGRCQHLSFLLLHMVEGLGGKTWGELVKVFLEAIRGCSGWQPRGARKP
ncbi:uncharacterized protein EI97DRAFT_501909 [Westerdykella ornata]|uniref:Uncharacterized protein n=1 Tax=Westerdykella ornata TaxID=318751 RepID=A0A6A6JHU0_WESOR|nr:uncharacterized protein EI97DRAFT_501909 [Westerdykella ornata]KAF2275764.1 hypothetical protein EI97DRAFT_501909 [Westerdykella ornata]